eukprot:CAMPEP_0206009614 /NCGR_PEP_ID=MMETSP1464-20131121/9996_1 /ASSEMBLY_ACC=CAM_ASM_001124 /TAXON_ID=119497 /ORGANISM="Exanthemachrysis gayraliae, Strain RCC1523" /LENGTH=254 /DNA_ID=CAMNT_0053383213 /DNA_START=165 /DNA_END=925 /DNA_ORIENTATION=+
MHAHAALVCSLQGAQDPPVERVVGASPLEHEAEQPLLVYVARALRLADVEAPRGRGHEVEQRAPRLGPRQEEVELDDAPQALREGAADEGDDGVTLRRVEGQVPQLGADLGLPEAVLVDEDARLAAMLRDKGPPPALQGLPFGLGLVLPAVADKGVDRLPVRRPGAAVGRRVGGVGRERVQVHAVERHIPQARPAAGGGRGLGLDGGEDGLRVDRGVKRGCRPVHGAAPLRRGCRHGARRGERLAATGRHTEAA